MGRRNILAWLSQGASAEINYALILPVIVVLKILWGKFDVVPTVIPVLKEFFSFFLVWWTKETF